MKTKLLFLFLIVGLFYTNTNAQWIQSLTVIPPNPTSNDPIMVLAECGFGSGGCDIHSQNQFQNGNLISAEALHCLGILSVICYTTDTFSIAPLPPGNYTFQFQLDAGQGPAPCTPGIVPGPTDTVSFVVTPPVGIGEYIPQDAYTLFPNPASDFLLLKGADKQDYPATLSFIDISGRLYKQVTVKQQDDKISILDFPSGMYQVQLQLKDGKQFLIQLLKK